MRPQIRVEGEGVIYRNPLPQLRSRRAYFPGVTPLPQGGFLASFSLGEAMESVNQTTAMSLGDTEGREWADAGYLIKEEHRGTWSDSAKVTALPDGRQVALGYRFDRSRPELPIGNPQTGGLLPNEAFFCERKNEASEWTAPQAIPTTFLGPVEASAPLTALDSGVWVSPIANFLDWQGDAREALQGRLLRSEDEGRTWTDEATTMRFPGGRTAVWEQRLCEYERGRLCAVAWVEDLRTGKALNNQIALSGDGGRTFSGPLDTGVRGQATGVVPLGGGLVMTLHAMRKETEQPGLLAVAADLRGQAFREVACELIWRAPVYRPNAALPGVFSSVRFGQPSAVSLGAGRFLVSFWREEDGEAEIRWMRISVEI